MPAIHTSQARVGHAPKQDRVPVSIDSPMLKGTENPAYFNRAMTNVVQKAPYLGSEDLPLLAI